ncbi:MAG: S8 family peptidase [Gammaproteobacteria bacterium]
MSFRLATAAGAAVLLALAGNSPVAGQTPGNPGSTARLIIQLRATATADNEARATTQALTATATAVRRARVAALTGRLGLPLRTSRDLGDDLIGLSLGRAVGGQDLAATLEALREDPDVEFAEVDQRRQVRTMPSDPLYYSQWYFQGHETAAANFEPAWDTTTGAADTVIAVLDTGVRFEHPDLAGRLLPGYDFVSGESSSSFVSANDGGDWDDDASDPGDWVTPEEAQSGPLAGCDESPTSSWHGTRVAAMLGATTNNAAGIAGGTWNGSVLPVRVLGKCGGYDSDIVAGMKWAAGLPVANAPVNLHPAQIINMSLGGPGACSATYRRAMAAMRDAGVLVVVSAGNASGPVDTPANCTGALAVAGLRHVGTKVGYSSFGTEVGIAAPGGNCPGTPFTCEYSLTTASNSGATVPGNSTYTDNTDANANIGTSFSAPVVTAIAALMRGVNAALKPDEYIARIRESARPFPAAQPGLPTCPATSPLAGSLGQCNCTASTCGAGIADAAGAVADALRPIARIVVPSSTPAGTNVTVIGSSSAAARNRTIAAYNWTAISPGVNFIGSTSGPSAAVAMPASGNVNLRLSVTDDAGRSDSADVTLVATRSGGGGGLTHPLVLAVLGLLLVRRRLTGR